MKPKKYTKEELDIIEKIPASKRTQLQHFALIFGRYNGSCRDYFLSMGAFKDVEIC